MTSTSFILTPALKAQATLPCFMRDPLNNGKVILVPKSSHPFSIIHQFPDDPPIQFGAHGLLSTFDGYSFLLRHLLQLASSSPIKPKVAPIISQGSWKSLFVGTLTKEAKVGLTATDENILEPGVDWSTALLLEVGHSTELLTLILSSIPPLELR